MSNLIPKTKDQRPIIRCLNNKVQFRNSRQVTRLKPRIWLFTRLRNSISQKIDRICEAMANAALAESARLGQMASEETGFGKADDKREKNRFASEDVWNYFKNLKTVGVVADKGSVVEIASPRGVVAAIIPSTNPTSTAIFKIIISIKSRNTIVLSPHPSAARCIAETARVMKEAGVKEGLPPDAIQCLTNSSLEGTETLMKHKKTAVILATGGIGLVRAAYSSGKPAFGVGPGNVPCFIERTANVGKAVSDILTGTCFDNGTICASEQSVVVDAPVEKEVREQFKHSGRTFFKSNRSRCRSENFIDRSKNFKSEDRRKISRIYRQSRGNFRSVRHTMSACRLRRSRARFPLVNRKAFADAGVFRR